MDVVTVALGVAIGMTLFAVVQGIFKGVVRGTRIWWNKIDGYEYWKVG